MIPFSKGLKPPLSIRWSVVRKDAAGFSKGLTQKNFVCCVTPHVNARLSGLIIVRHNLVKAIVFFPSLYYFSESTEY